MKTLGLKENHKNNRVEILQTTIKTLNVRVICVIDRVVVVAAVTGWKT